MSDSAWGVAYTLFWIGVLIAIGGLYQWAYYGFPLPGRRAPRSRRSDMPARESRTAPTPHAPQFQAQPQLSDHASEQRALTINEWLKLINDQPDRVPHTACTGRSGAGKTTLILAALARRPGRIVVCTPKNKREDAWGGLQAVRLRPADMSFDLIGQMITAVYQEMLRRNASDDGHDREWLTLVIDDFSTVIGKLPRLVEPILDIVTLGRSVRIRLILLATETNVRSWGWEGRGEARNNVLFIECEEDEQTGARRAAAYLWKRPKRALDVSQVYTLARSAQLAGREWHAEPDQRPAARLNLSSILEDDEDAKPVRHMPNQPTRTSSANWYDGGTPGTNAVRGSSGDLSDAELVRFLANQKRLDTGEWRFSANQIHGFVGGTRSKVLEWVNEARSAVPVE